jgi:regulator of sigma D
MLDDCNNKLERWNAVEQLLQAWLRERRDILVTYAALAAHPGTEVETTRLQALCELLVDYTSAGHFEVYYELVREAEAFGDDTARFTQELIPRIGDTTEVILGFDEKYPLANGQEGDCGADLSLLGEILESRFELEDRLISGLHRIHSAG